jgi:hypothetical protein
MELHASITFKSINEIKGKSDLPNSYIAKTTTRKIEPSSSKK